MSPGKVGRGPSNRNTYPPTARSSLTPIGGGDSTPVDHYDGVDLGPYLNAHAYLRVERPPELWEAECDDELLIRLTGELIVAALARGSELSDIGLLASNVVIDESVGIPSAGDYVAVTVSGAGDWGPEILWDPTHSPTGSLVGAEVDAAARALGVAWAYTRTGADGGSVTVLLPRLSNPRA
jgi:hypothetical protein